MNTYIPPGHTVCGTCSICGGAVTVPFMWHGVIPPVPTCNSCGATAAMHGPVIPMNPAPAPLTQVTTSTTGWDVKA